MSSKIYPHAKCIDKFISYSIIASERRLTCSYGESHCVNNEFIFATMFFCHHPDEMQVSGLVNAISRVRIVFSSLKFSELHILIITKSIY